MWGVSAEVLDPKVLLPLSHAVLPRGAALEVTGWHLDSFLAKGNL